MTMDDSVVDIRKNLKQKAFEYGFTEFGVAKADALNEEARRLREYLALGYHASMDWMARNVERRVDPGEIVPGARSVIMLAYNYFTGRSTQDDQKAKISNYAWGDNYHDVVMEKVRDLEVYLHEIAEQDVHSRSYVDTGPIMEKAWAVRAGIGWQGKHTNVIHREHGSWFFLGAIIADVEMEYDSPIQDYCGSCTRCIEACPTDAITEPYQLDSNKCLSFLTIEYRGDVFPEEQASNMNSWVFGCDICQEVCPWNHKFEHETSDEHFMPREKNINRDLKEWLDLTKEEFRTRFKKSPVKRAKYNGFMRNISAALTEQNSSK